MDGGRDCRCDQQHQAENHSAPSKRHHLLPHPIKNSSCGENPTRSQAGANEQKPTYVVRFPDVDEDFVGINEVVDGHGIEAGFELIKKEEFDKQQEDGSKPKEAAEAPKQSRAPESN